MIERFKIDKVGVSAVNLEQALDYIDQCIEEKKYGYICAIEARTVHHANHNEEYCNIQNNSLLTCPDGAPLTIIARNQGFEHVSRVCGPDLFPAVLERSKEKGYSHYFFGSTPDTIEKMKVKMAKEFPMLELKGAVSPPFQPLEEFDIDGLAKEINELKPTFFWCGLGAPKQEYIVSRLQPKLDSTICAAVGLVFDYFADNVKRPPNFMRKTGMEGIYRLSQQPEKIKPKFMLAVLSIIPHVIKSYFHKKK